MMYVVILFIILILRIDCNYFVEFWCFYFFCFLLILEDTGPPSDANWTRLPELRSVYSTS